MALKEIESAVDKPKLVEDLNRFSLIEEVLAESESKSDNEKSRSEEYQLFDETDGNKNRIFCRDDCCLMDSEIFSPGFSDPLLSSNPTVKHIHNTRRKSLVSKASQKRMLWGGKTKERKISRELLRFSLTG